MTLGDAASIWGAPTFSNSLSNDIHRISLKRIKIKLNYLKARSEYAIAKVQTC